MIYKGFFKDKILMGDTMISIQITIGYAYILHYNLNLYELNSE